MEDELELVKKSLRTLRDFKQKTRFIDITLRIVSEVQKQVIL